MVADLRTQTVGEVDASSTGLIEVDLKTQATTVGTLLDLRGYRSIGFSIIYTLAGAAATLGTAVLQAIQYADDGVTQLSEPVSIVTITSTQAAGTYRVWVAWSEHLAPALQAYGSGGTFTLGNPERLRALGKVKLQLNVSTAYDNGSDATANVLLQVAQ